MRSFILLAAAAFTSAASASLAATASPVLITADRIYTSPDAAPKNNGSVLIHNGRVAAVSDERSRIAIPEGTRTSECRGVVVAGFQNSHVHFTEEVWASAASAPVARLQGGLEAMLTRYGFTTVFDTGSDGANTLALRARIEKGELRGPRILTVGLPLYPPDGIPSYIRDLPPDLLARMPQPADAAEARRAVRDNLAAGTDGTKVFLITSPAEGQSRVMSLEVIKAAAEETHAKGKLLFAHPTALDGLRTAIEGGVDVLVHTTLGERQPWDAATVKLLVDRKISVIPTFKLWGYELRKGDVPAEIIQRLVAATLEELRTFVAAGGQVLFGTDVGYMHDYDPSEEYQLMEKAGLGPMQILASLTTAPAERQNESDRRGRVAAGFDADLVVLEADPAVDVRNFARVRCAFRAGELIYSAPARP